LAENLKGEKALQDKLKKAKRVIPFEMAAGLYQEGLLVMETSMRRTPVEIGTLRGSHETGQPEWKGKMLQVNIQVGGPAAPYAKIVHERIIGPGGNKVRHKTGQAKFLQSALEEATPGLAARLAKRIDLNKLG
jgi:hypothetical protein